MVRVLHLLGHTTDFQTEHGAAELAQHAPDDLCITTRTIGRGGHYRNPVSAFLSLRPTLEWDFDLIHAWNYTALAVAVMSGARNIVFTPPPAPDPRAHMWLQVAISRGNVYVACSSVAAQRWFVKRGASPERCHVIRPGVECSGKTGEGNNQLREALGFNDADYVVLAAGESTRPAGHQLALWAAGVLHVLDPQFRVLLWGRGDRIDACARFGEQLWKPKVLVIAERKLGRRVEFAELLPVADAVVLAPVGPIPLLPVASCMAAALPIVSTPSPWLADVLKHRDNAIVTPRRSARMVAQSVLELRRDPVLGAAISQRAKTDAAEFFSRGRFVAEYQKLYEKSG